ncbi:MAG: tryptophan--tRNA ligase [Bacteroidetes bacterium]|nr:tryptophan--tRNA ligase [Bacteroidota bacterium]
MSSQKEIVLSGIRPTGNLHLGNYFGAVTQFLKMQETHNCYFFVADYHSLTTHPNPVDLQDNVKTVLAEYLACGLDTNKCTLYVQSQLPETAELYLLLAMHAYKGELEKTVTFKEKARKQPNNINAGLLTYPVLMAADILIHRAAKVPVGEDQRQHLEMTRDYARRFNNIYNCEVFEEPQAFNFSGKLVKVPGLDGSTKMSKSDNENNCIFLKDDEATILKKLKKAKTDAGPTQLNQEKPQEIENLFNLANLVNVEMASSFEQDYNQMTIRYGDFKKAIAAEMWNYIQPIQERIESIKANDKLLDEVMAQGMEKAKESAHKTLNLVRDAIGLKRIY